MDDTEELHNELGIAVSLLRRLQTIARAELKTPGNSMRWGPVDLEATNALDSLGEALALLENNGPDRKIKAGTEDLAAVAAEVAASMEKATELAQSFEDKLACLDAAVHVSRLQRGLL